MSPTSRKAAELNIYAETERLKELENRLEARKEINDRQFQEKQVILNRREEQLDAREMSVKVIEETVKTGVALIGDCVRNSRYPQSTRG